METIKDTVKNVIQALETKEGQLHGGNPQKWTEELFSKKELRHIKFNYFRQGILGVYVDSSAWLYYFNLKKEGLLIRLHNKDAAVKNIYFRLGGVK